MSRPIASLTVPLPVEQLRRLRSDPRQTKAGAQAQAQSLKLGGAGDFVMTMGGFLTLFAMLTSSLGMLRPELRVLLCVFAFVAVMAGLALRGVAHRKGLPPRRWG